MGKRRHRYDLGCRCLGPGGSLEVTESTAVLRGEDTAGAAMDRVLAVVDGPQERRLELLDRIGQAFGPGGRAVAVQPGGEEAFLQSLLISLDPSGKIGRNPTYDGSAAIALCIGDTVIGGSFGGSRVVIVRSGDGAVQPPADTEFDAPLKVWRTRLAGEDAIVLIGEAIRKAVLDREIRQSVHGGEPHDAASWLATLGCSRSQRQSSAIVAMRHGGANVTTALGELEPPALPARSFAPPSRLVAAGAVGAAFLAIGAVLVPFFGAQSSIAAPFFPPYSLESTVLSPHHVILSWAGRIGVSDYQVQVISLSRAWQQNEVYDSRTSPSYNFDHVLRSGVTYAWRVRALYGPKAASGWVSGPWVSVPDVVIPKRPVPLAPMGHSTVSAKSEVRFCWSSSPGVTRFKLHLLEGSYSKMLSRNVTSVLNQRTGAYCLTARLPHPGSVAWQAGASFPHKPELWSPWKRTRVIRHRPVVHVSAPQATPAAPVQQVSPIAVSTPEAYYSPPAESQPSTYQPQPTSSASSSPTNPPGVKVCSDPPNC